MKSAIFYLFIGISFLSTAFPQPQDDSHLKEAVKNSDKPEKMSVVGSRIRRFDLEGAAPAVIITGEQIEKSGFHTIGGILRESTAVPYGGGTDQINVRGLGSENTLVMINGKRLPKIGSVYGNRASNVNAIPTSAIKRVEILTDGGSAVYGSEALGSVINIVTHSNLDGVNSGIQHKMLDLSGGDSTKVYSTYGQHSSQGHFNTSVEYIKGFTFYSRNLNYVGPDYLRAPFYMSDNYYTNNVGPSPFPECNQVHQDGTCRQYSGDINRSASNTFSMFSEVTRKLNSTLSFNADVLGRYRRSHSYSPASISGLKFNQDEIPSDWIEKLPNLNSTDQMLTIFHRFKDIEAKTIGEQYTFGFNIGIEGEWIEFLDGDWNWSLNHNLSLYKTVQTYMSQALINESKAAMISGQYNPFENGSTNLAGMLHDPKSKTNYFVETLDLSANGALWEIGKSTSVSMAMGVQLAYHDYEEQGDDQAIKGNVSGLRGINGKHKRTQQALYGELGLSHGSWLEGQLAARLDQYSDFGATFNPKLALQLKPFRWLMLRSSVGTGFKAPELPDLSDTKIEGYFSVKDYFLCRENPGNRRYCNYRSYPAESSGNPDLQEETSLSYNLGFGLNPTPNLSIVVDYWNYKLKNQIGRPVDDILKFERDGKKPEDYGYKIIRDENGSPDIDKIIAPLQNLGTKKTDGLDLKIDYSWKNITTRGSYSLQLNNQSRGIDGVPFESSLGDFGYPRYRYNISLDYTFPGEGYYLSIQRQTVGPYKDRKKLGRIPQNSQYDLTGIWKSVPWGGELTVGIKNLFNLRPKLDKSSDIYINTTLHDAYETYFVRYDHTF